VNTLGFVLSEKAGVAVVGIKTGLIMPTDDIVEVTMDAVEDIVDDGDIVWCHGSRCSQISESVYNLR